MRLNDLRAHEGLADILGEDSGSGMAAAAAVGGSDRVRSQPPHGYTSIDSQDIRLGIV